MRHNKSADGLRGIAAMCVVIAHFFDAFLPALQHKNFPQMFFENPNPSVLFKIFQLPIFSVFYNGHFAVLVFFVLSGYVLSMPYFRKNHDVIKNRIWGRYIRLNIPIVVALIIAYLVFRFNGYFNIQASILSGSVSWLRQLIPASLSAHEFLKIALYKSILFGDHTLDTTLWTLKIEFIGSLYLLLFYLCCGERVKISTFFAIFLLFLFYQQDSIYYIAIFLGALINIIKVKNKLFIFLLGMYFGAFQYENPIFNFLPTPGIFDVKTFYNTLGAFCVVLAVGYDFGRQFFELRAIQFLGRISFSSYLLHPIILTSLACYLYIHLPKTTSSLLLIFLIYIAFLLVCSYFFEKHIDRFAIKSSHKFAAYMSKSRGQVLN